MKEKQSIQLHTKFFDGQFIIKIRKMRKGGKYIDELLGQYFRSKEEWLKVWYGYRTLFDALGYTIEETIDERCQRELEEEVNILYLD